MLQDIFGASALPSGPTSKQTNTSSIQAWAQPYISNYLDKAQTLANQGPNAAQQQVYNAAQNLQTPEQFGQGSNLLNQAGQGQLGTVSQALGYGAQGAGYGQLATGAGQNYANMATNPSSVQAYMNPYIQQSLAPQLQMLNQQQALAGQGIAANAVGKGAFGGNRTTLAQGLNAQNYDLMRQQAIGQGYNTAFQNAQQAQQFGANLGLQGLATGIQGANAGLQGVQGAQQGYTGASQAGTALGNLGYQQGQQGLAALGLQNQIANQQYMQPFQNLQFQQSMLSGLPISSGTTTGYQAPPNAISQIGGLGTTLVGAYGLANKAGLLNDIKNPFAGSTSENPIKYDPSGAVTNSQITVQPDGGGYMTSAGNLIGGDGYSAEFAKGGKIKHYASGGKVGSDLTDIQLHRLLG
jgi:hypothetical protein